MHLASEVDIQEQDPKTDWLEKIPANYNGLYKLALYRYTKA